MLGVLPDLPQNAQVAWIEIAQTITRSQGKLILFIDAINENSDSFELLRQINYWADSLPRLAPISVPWLKIVLTCRTMVWRLLVGQTGLASHRFKFYTPRKGNSPADPEGNDVDKLTITLDRFTLDELQPAYLRYQQRYRLCSDFISLPEYLRKLIRDPLALEIVAQTYAGREIGGLQQVYKIYDDYAETMFESRRMHPSDLYILENEIVPRMVRNLTNQLKVDELVNERTQSGQLLYDLFFGYRLLSDALRSDTPFANLVDAGILSLSDPEPGGVVRFQHESLYDHYIGKHLVRQADVEAVGGLRSTWYAGFMHQVQDKPYLWGALKQALLLEVIEHQESALLPALLHDNQERLTKMLITNVLVQAGHDDLAVVQSVLENFLHPGYSAASHRNGLLSRRIHLSGAAAPVGKLEAILSQQIASDTARQLSMDHILLNQAVSEWEVVRLEAVRQMNFLWHDDEARCLQLLTDLCDLVQPLHRLTAARCSYRALRSAGHTSLFILISSYLLVDERQTEYLQHLQHLWKPVIERLLYYRPGLDLRSRAVGALSRPIRQGLLSSTVVNIVLQTLRDPSGASINGNLKAEMSAFYHLSAVQREKARFILDMITPECNLDVHECFPEMLSIARRGERLSNLLLEFGIRFQHFSRQQDMVAIVQQLFDVSMQTSPPNLAAASALETMFTLADNLGGPVNAPALAAYQEMIVRFYDQGDGLWVQGLHGKYKINHFGKYVSLYQRLHHQLPDDLIEKYTTRMHSEKTTAFAYHFLGDIQALLHDPGGAWERLGILKWAIDFDGHSEVDEQILISLARFGEMHPETLRSFLEENNIPSEYRKRIENSEAPEHLSYILFPYGITGGAVIERTPALWQELRWIVQVAFECTSLAQLIGLIAKRAVNTVYAGPIFKLPE